MWQTEVATSNAGRTQKYRLLQDDVPLGYAEVLVRWRKDAGFRSFFTGLLVDAPFAAYRWETPPVTESTIGREFEFVLLRSDTLERTVDPAAFTNHFRDELDVATFPNLGGDAVMVVPCPRAPNSVYGHLAAFLRRAPKAQVHDLWRSVGEAMAARLSERAVWLSTAGMGVAWLHVRLDSRPKYYSHAPYRELV
jgi:hypothetical protein